VPDSDPGLFLRYWNLDEETAKVAKLQAEAAEIAARSNGDNDVARKTQAMADEQMAMMAEKLREVQSSSAAQIMALRADRDTGMEIARIESDIRIRVAEISRRADAAIDDMQGRLSESTEPTNQQNEVRT
jgi:hypothetical protein